MKIKLLNDCGYRGFVNAKFPMLIDLKDDEFEDYCGLGFDIKTSAIPYYSPECGIGDDDYNQDSEDDYLYFSLVSNECEVIE